MTPYLWETRGSAQTGIGSITRSITSTGDPMINPQTRRAASTAAAIALSLALAACSGGGTGGAFDQEDVPPEDGAEPPAGFTFTTAEVDTLDIIVQLDGNPVMGATVQMAAGLTGDEDPEVADQLTQGALLYHGTTDAAGQIDTDIVVPAEIDSVVLTVDLRGSSGPYSDESERTEFGRFAPSSRQTVDRSNLTGPLTVDLITD